MTDFSKLSQTGESSNTASGQDGATSGWEELSSLSSPSNLPDLSIELSSDPSNKLSSEDKSRNSIGYPESQNQPNNSHPEEGPHERLYRRLEERLANAFYLIVEGLMYEGNINDVIEFRVNKENYTPIMGLAPLISIEQQQKMIDEYVETGKIVKSLGDANEKLARAIIDSRFVENNEFYSFCRQKRADHLAGRLNFNQGSPYREDEWILKSIWAIDPNFYGSKEAKGLITDSDYIHYIYGKGINNILNRYQLDPSVAEATAENYEKNLSGMIESCLEDGTLTIEEILSDPFLRRLHMAAHLGRFDGSSSAGPLRATERIWELDGADFYNSPMFINYLNKIRADNIGVLKDVPIDEVYEQIEAISEKIPDEKILEILQAYSQGLRRGDNVLKDSLLPVLGLLNSPPNIVYVPSDRCDEEGRADYYREENTIYYYLDYDSWQNPIPPQPILFDDDLFDHMNTIAHEMFHAHQTHGNNVDPELARLYEQNKLVYIRSRDNYEAYREQIMEATAYAFGDNFEWAARVVYEFQMENK